MNQLRARAGLTLIELLIFAAIFMMISVVFVAILISVTRVYVRQSATAEVNQQSSFLLQTIQRYIEQSSVIHDDMPPNEETNVLTLYVPTSPDLVRIYVDGNDDGIPDPSGIVYIEATNTDTNSRSREPLTSDAVTVSDAVFRRHTQRDAKDSVSFRFTMTYESPNPEKRFSQTLSSGIARVNAATFDSDLIPSGSRTIGTAISPWQSVNGVLYFSGGNVGIGTSNPQQTLEVQGGVMLNPPVARPSCGVGTRGTLWFTPQGIPGALSAGDVLQVCIVDANGDWVWQSLY